MSGTGYQPRQCGSLDAWLGAWPPGKDHRLWVARRSMRRPRRPKRSSKPIPHGEEAPARSYFAGCSDGGREARAAWKPMPILERLRRHCRRWRARRIPVGGSALLANGVSIDQALTATPDSWISPEKLSVVTEAALKACNGENGIIDDPGECHFDPSSLICKAGETGPMSFRAASRRAEDDLFRPA